jgi:hypothetical protein
MVLQAMMYYNLRWQSQMIDQQLQRVSFGVIKGAEISMQDDGSSAALTTTFCRPEGDWTSDTGSGTKLLRSRCKTVPSHLVYDLIKRS